MPYNEAIDPTIVGKNQSFENTHGEMWQVRRNTTNLKVAGPVQDTDLEVVEKVHPGTEPCMGVIKKRN